MKEEDTIHTPGAAVVFYRDGTHASVSLNEAEYVRHPWFSEQELIRRAEKQLALNKATVPQRPRR